MLGVLDLAVEAPAVVELRGRGADGVARVLAVAQCHGVGGGGLAEDRQRLAHPPPEEVDENLEAGEGAGGALGFACAEVAEAGDAPRSLDGRVHADGDCLPGRLGPRGGERE